MASTLPVPGDCDNVSPCQPGCTSISLTDVQALIQAAVAANSNFQTQPTAVALKTSTNHQQGWGAWCDALTTPGDGQGGFWDYQANSNAPDDPIAYTVIKPIDVVGNGRWIKRQ